MKVEKLKIDLTELAKQSLEERGFKSTFPPEVIKEVEEIIPRRLSAEGIKDMRNCLWFSIDNDDSRDLDQLSFAQEENSSYRIYIAVADVTFLVKENSATDRFAAYNTTSIYTPTKVFPMLPEKLSTNLTSLNEHEDRLAIIVEIEVTHQGQIESYFIYLALVNNKAKLTYKHVEAYLEGKIPVSPSIIAISGLPEQLRLHDKIAQTLRRFRKEQGSLDLDSYEYVPVMTNGHLTDIRVAPNNRAKEIIEDFMITANIVMARFFKKYQLPSLRRIVRTPDRWDKIVEVALALGDTLPPEPDVKALESFLLKRKSINPEVFAELSLTIIKLLGKGEYVVEQPGQKAIGHFSLAIKDYTHSTAPNRRYSDLATQRILKAFLSHHPSPYTIEELEEIAKRCTQKEDDANKVERKLKKCAAILVLASQDQNIFDGIVTGASPKGTWVRIRHPAVEGKLVKGFEGLDVGDAIKVQLLRYDIEKGFIDFIRLA